jgi:hypothetical protein
MMIEEREGCENRRRDGEFISMHCMAFWIVHRHCTPVG